MQVQGDPSSAAAGFGFVCFQSVPRSFDFDLAPLFSEPEGAEIFDLVSAWEQSALYVNGRLRSLLETKTSHLSQPTTC